MKDNIILQTRGLKKYYGKGETLVKALDGIDLDIERGKFTAIIGTSGSGATGDAPDPRKYGNWRRGGYYDDAGRWHSYASGLGRVPYDNYPAVLHQGERVLTAAEARSYNRGGGGSIQIVMNGTVIREEADVERIGDEFLSRLIQARVAGVYK